MHVSHDSFGSECSEGVGGPGNGFPIDEENIAEVGFVFQNHVTDGLAIEVGQAHAVTHAAYAVNHAFVAHVADSRRHVQRNRNRAAPGIREVNITEGGEQFANVIPQALEGLLVFILVHVIESLVQGNIPSPHDNPVVGSETVVVYEIPGILDSLSILPANGFVLRIGQRFGDDDVGLLYVVNRSECAVVLVWCLNFMRGLKNDVSNSASVK